jgi:hypothetical protein
MIYVTGDTHGDLRRFRSGKIRRLKKGDTLLICGDFGFVWDGSEEEAKKLQWLSKRKYTIAFVDGCHENYDRLDALPVEEWQGGSVHRLGENLVHLLRGGMYEIEGKKIFAFGGGESKDKEIRVEQKSWYEHELPTTEELRRGAGNLEKAGFAVDYIITHTGPARSKVASEEEPADNGNRLDIFLAQMLRSVKFERWFYGECHQDRMLSGRMFSLFEAVMPADAGELKRNK